MPSLKTIQTRSAEHVQRRLLQLLMSVLAVGAGVSVGVLLIYIAIEGQG